MATKEQMLLKLAAYTEFLGQVDAHLVQVSDLSPNQVTFVLQCAHIERLRKICIAGEATKGANERKTFAQYLKELATMEEAMEKMAAQKDT